MSAEKWRACGTRKNQKACVSAPCGRRRPVGKSADRALRVPSDAEAAREGGDDTAGIQTGAEACAVPSAIFKTSQYEVFSAQPINKFSVCKRYVT